jgi:hypothetical protein
VARSTRSHDAVTHPREFLATEKTAIGRANDWAASHLAVIFGLVWTVWLFATVPLLVLLAPSGLRSVVFYLASGWIQLWALPLFVYVGNKLQKSSDAQSDAQHQALTHIATVEDELKELIELNNGLTAEIHRSLTIQGKREFHRPDPDSQ